MADRHDTLLLHLENYCRMVYLKATKLKQVMLQQRAKMQWRKGGDQCSKVFFRRVAMQRANKRIFQVFDEDGRTYTEPQDVSDTFVEYFRRLLGGERVMRNLDLRYLRSWARHIITEEEANSLSRPITTDDMKNAIFDIEEDRAPGPDWFSSGFFKAAWPVVGAEVMTAVMDFFSTGYNQSRLPPRCALKVDLRKAYDTVEWDFLVATLHLFGFLMAFIRWIEECVTTLHFSLYLNGEVHGFFAGARGLRQGDPMSPYLFVLVMEDLNLFQLSFADDLLLLSKAEVRSVNLFRRGLEVFASLSGLHTNPQKSQLIISKAAQGIRSALIDTLGYQEGQLPVRYLGLPLISSHLTISDCQPLFQKIDRRNNGWEGTSLSFTGRVQLIKSVLLALGVYWAMAFLLPKGVIKEIVKRLRNFLWKGTSASGYPKVARDLACRPLEEGGQGIRDVLALNRALMSRHLWSVICHDRTSIWVDWIVHYRLRGKSIWTVSTTKGAWGWRKMLTLGNILLPHIKFRVGYGDSFSIWHDPWHCLGPLILAFPRGPQLTQTAPHDLLNVVIDNSCWRWPLITDIACLEITRLLSSIHHGNDSIT
ncbi:Retrovirus-related Pol polyprotein from type-1 retrotransposable element R2 [Sesamum angolense]|uniref:Retrovirus-related Pol polyprotein from type-1 retrotransposable element R2 n=1 Tax=Sesamum angolense TaxID=2727404 RepID=A0AAE1TAP3_9LAMI|nr:Retrovirus-related Pol polyprotein from type-1 retrotransposable element R2 [Sesamum angolense]